MRPLIKTIVILTGFLLFSPTSYAATGDGNSLLAACVEAEKFMDNNKVYDSARLYHCFGMVEGVHVTMAILVSEGPHRACFPKGGITTGQSARIVLAYLRKNPARLHEVDVLLTIDAYMDAYPCE